MNNAVIALVGAFLVGLAPVVRALVLTKLTPERLSHITDISLGAVRAAERLAELVPGTTGQQKLDYASSVIVAGSKRLGIHLTDNEVLAFVHVALAVVDA